MASAPKVIQVPCWKWVTLAAGISHIFLLLAPTLCNGLSEENRKAPALLSFYRLWHRLGTRKGVSMHHGAHKHPTGDLWPFTSPATQFFQLER